MAVYKRKDKWGDRWRYRRWVTLPDGQRVRVAGTPSLNTKRVEALNLSTGLAGTTTTS